MCKNTEKLAVVEQRFFDQDEEIRKKYMYEQNFYLAGGGELNKNKTIEENNIQDKAKLIMYVTDM